MGKSYIATLLFLIVMAGSLTDDDMGTIRLNKLRERSYKESNQIITFSKEDF
jgi:hypothetical protein